MEDTMKGNGMTKTRDYCRFFDTEDAAEEHMRKLNRMLKVSGLDPVVLTDGPEDNFAVIDLSTAIEMDVPYRWAV
jgi:hypothetical protein